MRVCAACCVEPDSPGLGLHVTDAREAEEALVAAGFRAARVSPAVDVAGEDRERGSRLANILEASINLPPEASTT